MNGPAAIRAAKFTADESREALRPIASLIGKSRKAQQKLAPGTWQHMMLGENLKALRIASALLSKGTDDADRPAREDLQEARRALASMINKTEKAKAIFSPGTSQHTLQRNRLAALRRAETAIKKELAMSVMLKRVYEHPAKTDGKRILVDRLWPRGLSKVKAGIDLWLKDVAPSTGLRQWFGHAPEKWPEFQRRYRAELKGNPALAELKALSRQGGITLVYAARDQMHNEAVVLKEIIGRGASA